LKRRLRHARQGISVEDEIKLDILKLAIDDKPHKKSYFMKELTKEEKYSKPTVYKHLRKMVNEELLRAFVPELEIDPVLKITDKGKKELRKLGTTDALLLEAIPFILKVSDAYHGIYEVVVSVKAKNGKTYYTPFPIETLDGSFFDPDEEKNAKQEIETMIHDGKVYVVRKDSKGHSS
jgi:DNA-binding MarR family transcriptional regulator